MAKITQLTSEENKWYFDKASKRGCVLFPKYVTSFKLTFPDIHIYLIHTSVLYSGMPQSI